MMSIILSVIIDVKMYMYIDCVCLCVCVCVWIGDYRSPTGDNYMCMYSYTCRYKIKKNVQKLSIQYLHCLFQTKCCLTQFVKYLRHQKKKNEIDCNNSRKIRLFSRYLHSRFISRVLLSLESAPFQYFISHRDNSVHIF